MTSIQDVLELDCELDFAKTTWHHREVEIGNAYGCKPTDDSVRCR